MMEWPAEKAEGPRWDWLDAKPQGAHGVAHPDRAAFKTLPHPLLTFAPRFSISRRLLLDQK